MKLSTQMLWIAIILLSLALGSFAKAWQHEKQANAMLVELDGKLRTELYQAQQKPQPDHLLAGSSCDLEPGTWWIFTTEVTLHQSGAEDCDSCMFVDRARKSPTPFVTDGLNYGDPAIPPTPSGRKQ